MDLITLIISLFALFVAFDTKKQFKNLIDNNLSQKRLIEPQKTSVQTNNTSKDSAILPKVDNYKHEEQIIKKQKKSASPESWLLKIGAAFIFLAILWFAKYAFDQNWIGIYGRITLASAVSMLIFVYAIYDISINRKRGLVLASVGLTSFVATMFVAYNSYNIIDQSIFIMASALASFTGVALAVYKKSNKLALYGLLVSYIIPAIVGENNNTIFSLYNYIITINIVGLSAAYLLRNWSVAILPVLASIIYYTPNTMFATTSDNKVLIYGLLFAILFAFAPYIDFVINKEKDTYSNIISKAFMILSSVIFVYMAISSKYAHYDELAGFLITIASLVFAILGASIYVISKNLYGSASFASFAIIEFTIGLSLILGKYSIPILLVVVAYSLSTLLLFIFKSYSRPVQIIYNSLYTLSTFGAIVALMNYYDSYWIQQSLLHPYLIAAFAQITLSALQIYTNKKTLQEKSSVTAANKTQYVVISLITLLLTWIIPHVLLSSDTAVAVTLITYTIYALALFSVEQTRRFGFALFIAIALRIILVDIWGLDILLRILLLIIVGATLVSTTYIINRKNKDAYENKEG